MHLVHTSTRAIYKAAKDQIKPPPGIVRQLSLPLCSSTILTLGYININIFLFLFLFIYLFIYFYFYFYLFIYLYPPLLGPKLDGQIVRFKSALNIVKHKKEDKKNAFGISQHS